MSWQIECERASHDAVGRFTTDDVGREIRVRNPFWLGQENEISQRMVRMRREHNPIERQQIERLHITGEINGGKVWCPRHPDDQYLPINLWDETP